MGSLERNRTAGSNVSDKTGDTTRRVIAAAPLQGMDVLIVEDEAIINLDLAMSVETFGARNVVSAHSLEEAAGALDEGRFDLAILDLGLPDGDALPLAEDLRQGGVRIVFYSGDDDRTSILSSFPGAGYVMKPATEKAWADVFTRLGRPAA